MKKIDGRYLSRLQELAGLRREEIFKEENGENQQPAPYEMQSDGSITFDFWPGYMGEVDRKLYGLKVEAKKYGVEFEYELSEKNAWRNKAKMRLETPSLKDQGYDLVCTVETTSAGNLVFPSIGFEGENFVTRYGNGQFRCQECGTTRRRNFYHIFRKEDTGEDFVYGNDCAQRKFGVDFLKKIENIITKLGQVVKTPWVYDEDGELIGMRRKAPEPLNSFNHLFGGALVYYSNFKNYAKGGQVEMFINGQMTHNEKGITRGSNDSTLNAGIASIKRVEEYFAIMLRFFGVAVPEFEGYGQSDSLWEMYKKHREFLNRLYTLFHSKEMRLREELKNFYENTFVPKANNEFDTNMKIVVLDAYNRGTVKAGKNNIFLFAVWFWFRKTFLSEEPNADSEQGNVTNEFFGEVGQMVRNMRVKCVNRTDQPQRGQYGEFYRYNLKDAEGHKFTFYNSIQAFMEKDAEYTIDAEIGKHQEYAENKVTVLRNVVKKEPTQQGDQLAQASFEPVQAGEHVGRVGERLKKIKAKLISKMGPMGNENEGFYFKYEFDYNGNNLYSFTGRNFDVSPGQEVVLTGTVKAQKEYKGKKTTQLNRIDMTSVAPSGEGSQPTLREAKNLRGMIREMVARLLNESE